MVQCLPEMSQPWVRSLGWEDPLEKEMATHSSILAWKIPWTEDPGGLQSMGSQSRTQLRVCTFTSLKHTYTGTILIKPKNEITADGDCNHEIKRCLLLGRKVMTKLDSILKSRDITLSTKLRLVKAMVFLVVMYECEKNHELPKYERKLSTEELMLLNSGVGEDS